jgi:hypothetical protein
MADRYDDMTYLALKSEAADRGLGGAGTADELKAKLRAADAEQAETAQLPTTTTTVTTAELAPTTAVPIPPGPQPTRAPPGKDEVGAHAHANYPSDEDLDNRVAAASGQVEPTQHPEGPVPQVGGHQ